MNEETTSGFSAIDSLTKRPGNREAAGSGRAIKRLVRMTRAAD
jgi:hypothetical protein